MGGGVNAPNNDNFGGWRMEMGLGWMDEVTNIKLSWQRATDES